MQIRIRRAVLTLLLFAGLVVVVPAAPADAHPGPGAHVFCQHRVEARSFCQTVGSQPGAVAGRFFYLDAAASSNVEVCAIVDVFNTSVPGTWRYVTRLKSCGITGAQLLVPTNLQQSVHIHIAHVYNRSSRAAVIGGVAGGDALG